MITDNTQWDESMKNKLEIEVPEFLLTMSRKMQDEDNQSGTGG